MAKKMVGNKKIIRQKHEGLSFSRVQEVTRCLFLQLVLKFLKFFLTVKAKMYFNSLTMVLWLSLCLYMFSCTYKHSSHNSIHPGNYHRKKKCAYDMTFIME